MDENWKTCHPIISDIDVWFVFACCEQTFKVCFTLHEKQATGWRCFRWVLKKIVLRGIKIKGKLSLSRFSFCKCKMYPYYAPSSSTDCVPWMIRSCRFRPWSAAWRRGRRRARGSGSPYPATGACALTKKNPKSKIYSKITGQNYRTLSQVFQARLVEGISTFPNLIRSSTN